MRKSIPTILVILVSLSAVAGQPAKQTDGRDADRDAIYREIGRITQAFIDGDVETIYKTHSEDWSGYLNDGQVVPIKGVDEYMKAYGLSWPPPAGYKAPGPNPFPNLHYKITNFLVNFVTPDVGVASFTLDYPARDGANFNRLRIMDVFAKRNGQWLQTASYTVTDPAWKAERLSVPAPVPDPIRKQILDAREAVWRAWFANDRAKLETMIPEEAVAINGDGKEWGNRSVILDGAKRFADSGGKLTRLEFPRTEIQLYGNTVILYTSYSYDIERDGKKTTTTGNGVETFVRRNGALVNAGWILADAK